MYSHVCVQFLSGKLCASIQGVTTYRAHSFSQDTSGTPAREVCLPSDGVSDGVWHTITASRFGHELVLEIDDGDQTHERNETLVMLAQQASTMGPPHKLLVDKQDGISLAGIPQFAGVDVLNVEEDFYDSERIEIAIKLLYLYSNIFRF